MSVAAREFATIKSKKDLIAALNTNPSKLLILGGGSNMLLTKDVDALVLHINIKGVKVISSSENNVRVEVGAGENWHEFVSWCLDKNSCQFSPAATSTLTLFSEFETTLIPLMLICNTKASTSFVSNILLPPPRISILEGFVFKAAIKSFLDSIVINSLATTLIPNVFKSFSDMLFLITTN